MRNILVAAIIACFMIVTACEKKAGQETETSSTEAKEAGMGAGKDVAEVELRSGTLVAFDLPDEKGARYSITDFEPGVYRIPLKAIRRASSGDEESGNIIYVDTGMIFFIDADYIEKFRAIENRIWEETMDSYQIIERYDSVVEELGIKFSYFNSPGVDSGYDFEGDGAYVLDISQISRVSK